MSKIFSALTRNPESSEMMAQIAAAGGVSTDVTEPAPETAAGSPPAPKLVEWTPRGAGQAHADEAESANNRLVIRMRRARFLASRISGGEATASEPRPTPDSAKAAPAESAGPGTAVSGLPAPVRSPIRILPVRAVHGHPIFPFDLGGAEVNEGYRKIRTQLLQSPAEPRVLVISSPSPGDGKTLTAINLAGVLALKRDLSVILVDADLRHGDIANRCGLPQGPGLGEYLAGRCRAEDALIRIEQFPNLYILPCGEYRTNPVELLDSSRWRELVAQLRQRFRFVVIDVPPMGALADYDLVEAVSDGTILVVRQDHTPRTAVQRALESIPEAKRLGVVMNATRAFLPRRHREYGYYRASTDSPSI